MKFIEDTKRCHQCVTIEIIIFLVTVIVLAIEVGVFFYQTYPVDVAYSSSFAECNGSASISNYINGSYWEGDDLIVDSVVRSNACIDDFAQKNVVQYDTIRLNLSEVAARPCNRVCNRHVKHVFYDLPKRDYTIILEKEEHTRSHYKLEYEPTSDMDEVQ
jgi:hypothetical protein